MSVTQKDDHTHVPVWRDDDSETERQMMDAYITGAEVWRKALQQVAVSDLRRCSAGYLQRIALHALISTGQRVSDE